MSDVSDEILIALAGAGDRAAYRALVDRHLTRMVGIAQRILGNRADAEDATQEAFLRIWVHAPRWQADRARFTTWAYRILMNLCLDVKRRPMGASLEGIAEPADPALDAMEELDRQQTWQRVHHAMATLPDQQRAVIALCYYEGLSNAEAAEVLSVTVGAIESLLVRARRRLRERLLPGAVEREG